MRFPNPCPVCGTIDEHAAWAEGVHGSPATFCPHPQQPGHGTGCCCAGKSRPLSEYPLLIRSQIDIVDVVLPAMVTPPVVPFPNRWSDGPSLAETDDEKEDALRPFADQGFTDFSALVELLGEEWYGAAKAVMRRLHGDY